MKHYIYKISYVLFITSIILALLFIKDMNEMIEMILGAIAIITTSMFTYSIKDDIPYRRTKKDRSQ